MTDRELYKLTSVHFINNGKYNAADKLLSILKRNPETKNNWTLLKSALQSKFGVVNAEWLYDVEFARVNQSSTVGKYADEFVEAFDRSRWPAKGITLDDFTAVFYTGLNPTIATGIQKSTRMVDVSFDALVVAAKCAEEHELAKSGKPDKDRKKWTKTESATGEKKCFRCDKPGHVAAECFAYYKADGTKLTSEPPVKPPLSRPKTRKTVTKDQVQKEEKVDDDSSGESSAESEKESRSSRSVRVSQATTKNKRTKKSKKLSEQIELLSPGTLESGIPITIFFDGGSMIDILSSRIVEEYSLPTVLLKRPIEVQGFQPDGKPERITEKTAPLTLRIGEHEEEREFLVTKLDNDLLLGLPWMQEHGTKFDTEAKKMYFAEKCNEHMGTPTIQNITIKSAGAIELLFTAEKPRVAGKTLAENPLVRISSVATNHKWDEVGIGAKQFKKIFIEITPTIRDLHQPIEDNHKRCKDGVFAGGGGSVISITC
jgi:hypothetical protein